MRWLVTVALLVHGLIHLMGSAKAFGLAAALETHKAEAQFTHGRQTITAALIFGDDGLLRDFISDDRSRLAADGKSATERRFSTPVRDYRKYGSFLLSSHGEARWHTPEGDFAYGEFDLVDVAYNHIP